MSLTSLVSLKRFMLAVLAALSLSVTVKAAQPAAPGCDCIEDLSHRLMAQISQLQREYTVTFRGARQYQHGLNDLRQITAQAAHLHESAHGAGSREHLRADVQRLDEAFHHFQSVVGEMSRGGQYGHWGWESRTFRRLMSSVGTTIHQLGDMVDGGCGCAVPSGNVPAGHSAPAGGWSPSNGWNEWNGPATMPVVPTTPTIPPYPGQDRQLVPQRSGAAGGGFSFRL
jgi:hypothetical protein